MFFETTQQEGDLWYAAEGSADWGLGIFLDVRLQRLPRQKCSICRLRRICFSLVVKDLNILLTGRPVCAQHAGIR